jgi:Fe-S oxidoreductase/nitrate reductase gamma subunit
MLPPPRSDLPSPAPSQKLLTREVFGNVPESSQWIFYGLAAIAVVCFGYGVYRRVRLWRRGQPAPLRPLQDGVRQFLANVFLQRRMVSRPGASRAHRLLFGGFAVLFVGTVLIAIEHLLADLLGRSPTNPVFHKGVYYAIYEVVLDLFGLAMLLGCVLFIRRRWRGDSSIETHPLDWVVLGCFLAIGLTGYVLEGLRIVLAQTPLPGLSFVGYGVARVFQAGGLTSVGAAAPHYWAWWLHAALALALIAAFPYTRLIHSIAGALNLSLPREPLGRLSLVTLEEFEKTERIGVGEVEHFRCGQLVQLDACVSCGRCEDVCPAHEAGKPLSPRNVVQDVRSHLEHVASHRDDNAHNNAPARLALHGDTISADTLWSCTTCSACVDVCPLGVSPLGLITDMRRHLIGEGQLSGAPAASLSKVQRTGNPWGLPKGERLAWAAGLDVPTVRQNPDFEYLYWVGCAAAYDRRIQSIARSVVKLLQAAGVSFAVLADEEKCTGESARRMGDEFLFQELAAANVEVLSNYRVRKIVVHCPHCLNSFRHDYPQVGGEYEVIHHSQLLADLVDQGRLPMAASTSPQRVAFHDPCYLARVNGVTEPPRQLLQIALPGGETSSVTELPRHGRQTACCGGGGGRMWFDDAPAERSGQGRVDEILQTGVEAVAVACPFCLVMLRDGMAARESDVLVKDISEIYADALEPPSPTGHQLGSD